MEIVDLVNKFGVPVGVLIATMVFMAWIIKTMISHFITTIHEQTEERKETSVAFLNALSKITDAINQNTAITQDTHAIIKETAMKIALVGGGRR